MYYPNDSHPSFIPFANFTENDSGTNLLVFKVLLFFFLSMQVLPTRAIAYNNWVLLDGFGSNGARCSPTSSTNWACTYADGSMLGTFLSSGSFTDPLPPGTRMAGYSVQLSTNGATQPGLCDQTKVINTRLNGTLILSGNILCETFCQCGCGPTLDPVSGEMPAYIYGGNNSVTEDWTAGANVCQANYSPRLVAILPDLDFVFPAANNLDNRVLIHKYGNETYPKNKDLNGDESVFQTADGEIDIVIRVNNPFTLTGMENYPVYLRLTDPADGSAYITPKQSNDNRGGDKTAGLTCTPKTVPPAMLESLLSRRGDSSETKAVF
jgi:hypothetical protein